MYGTFLSHSLGILVAAESSEKIMSFQKRWVYALDEKYAEEKI